jgi:hypothetical protein
MRFDPIQILELYAVIAFTLCTIRLNWLLSLSINIIYHTRPSQTYCVIITPFCAIPLICVRPPPVPIITCHISSCRTREIYGCQSCSWSPNWPGSIAQSRRVESKNPSWKTNATASAVHESRLAHLFVCLRNKKAEECKWYLSLRYVRRRTCWVSQAVERPCGLVL